MSEKTIFAGSNGPSCLKCRFFDRPLNETGQVIEICRLAAPRVFAVPVGMGPGGPQWSTITAWPKVSSSDWCGHFTLKQLDS